MAGRWTASRVCGAWGSIASLPASRSAAPPSASLLLAGGACHSFVPATATTTSDATAIASTSLLAAPVQHRAGRRSFATSPSPSTTHSAFDFAAPQPEQHDAAIDVNGASSLVPRRAHPQRVVLLSGLPVTATPSDVRRLETDGQHVDHVEFLRTQFFAPSGKALVYFSTENWARRFEELCHKRILGASVLDSRRMSQDAADAFLLEYYCRHPRHLQLPFDLVDYESGKVVMLRGLPTLTTEEKLATKLGRVYDLREPLWWRGKRRSNAGYHMARRPTGPNAANYAHHQIQLGSVVRLPNNNDDASTVSFLVRLKTTYEAQRLARRWHNSYFTPQRFNIDTTGGRFRIDAHVVY